MVTATATRGVVSRGSKASTQMDSFEVDGRAAAPLLADGNSKAVNSSASDSFLASYSHPLVVPSNKALTALLVVPLIVWWVAVLAGVWVYEGLPKGQKVYHVMMWFDKGLLRPAGPLVPFAVVLLRAAVHVAEHLWQQRTSGGSAAAAKQKQQGGPRLGSLLVNCLMVYTAMAVARLAVYLTHYFLISHRYLEFHIVSDHIFLASTMLICLHTEVVCLMSDMLRVETRLAQQQQQQPGRRNDSLPLSEVALTLLLVMALFLYLFTAADMYFTAKYYHFPLESLTTTLLVFIMFQCPMLLWIVNKRQRAHALHCA